MKRFYFLLICALISVQIFAQDKWADMWCDTWNIMEHDMGLTGDTEKTWRHYIAQDTIINEQTYSIVNSYWTLEETNVYRSALVRFAEDKKVYAFIDDTEYLVYDFAVQVGDTIETIVGVGYGSMLQQLLVHQIDIDGATNRKTITLYPICRIEDDEYDEDWVYLWDCCPVQWIEGVGSTDGFLMGYPPCGWVGGIGCNLLCAYKGDELRYASRLYDSYGCEYNSAAQKWADTWCDTWNVMGFDGMIFDQSAETNQYKLAQDTIIGDYKYTMLTRRRTNSPISTLEYVAAVRFTGDKKVYAHIENTELLVYDFNAQVGDTLEVFPGIDFPIETYKCVVYNVEKNLETNQNTIHLHPLDIEGNIIEIEFVGPWIEGVGSETGFLVGLSPDRVASWNFSLLCAYKGDELKYTGIFYDDYDCEYNATTAVEDIPTPKISSKKFLQNDQLLILHDGKTYNVMGVEVGQ